MRHRWPTGCALLLVPGRDLLPVGEQLPAAFGELPFDVFVDRKIRPMNFFEAGKSPCGLLVTETGGKKLRDYLSLLRDRPNPSFYALLGLFEARQQNYSL